MLQFYVLVRLFHTDKKLKVSDISNSLELPASSMTEMLDKLEEQGLIKRQRAEDDRRVVLVEATKKSRLLQKKLVQYNLHFVKGILDKLGKNEKKTALKIAHVLQEYSRSLVGDRPENRGDNKNAN